MNATTFDTLTVARRFEAAGVDEKQAEAIAEAMREVSVANRGDFATKADFVTLEAQISVAGERLKAEFKAEMASAVNRMTFTMLIAMGVLFAALKLF